MVSSVPPKKASIEKSKVLFHSQMKQKHYIIDQLGLYEHPKLVLMGHSIGARMMLDCIHENTLLAIGLTPTIERMSITPRGKDLTPHFNSSIYGLSIFLNKTFNIFIFPAKKSPTQKHVFCSSLFLHPFNSASPCLAKIYKKSASNERRNDQRCDCRRYVLS